MQKPFSGREMGAIAEEQARTSMHVKLLRSQVQMARVDNPPSRIRPAMMPCSSPSRRSDSAVASSKAGLTSFQRAMTSQQVRQDASLWVTGKTLVARKTVKSTMYATTLGGIALVGAEEKRGFRMA